MHLETENASLNNKVIARDAVVNMLQKEANNAHTEEHQKLREEIASLQNKVDSREVIISSYERQHQRLKDKIEALQQEYLSKDIEMKSLKKGMKELRAEKEQQIADLQKEFEKSTKFSIKLNRDIEENKKELELRIEDLLLKKKENEERIKKSNRRIRGLKKQLDFYHQANDDMQNVINTERQEMHTLQIEYHDLYDDFEEAQRRYQELEATKRDDDNRSEAIISDLTAQNRDLQQSYEFKLSQTKSFIKDLQDLNEALSTKIVEVQEKQAKAVQEHWGRVLADLRVGLNDLKGSYSFNKGKKFFSCFNTKKSSKVEEQQEIINTLLTCIDIALDEVPSFQ